MSPANFQPDRLHPNRLHPDALIRKAPGPVETTVGNEVVLMELGAGSCYGLGNTGSDVWRHLSQPIRFTTLIHNLRAEYEAPQGVLEQDVSELLEDLRTRNLILVE